MKRNAGFTLVEVMIAVVVIAIITGVAVTNYRSSMQNSRRSTAQADLMSLAQFMERTHTEAMSYMPGATPAAPTLPFTVSPQSGTTYYTITLQAITSKSYTLRATPTGTQASNGILEVDSTGAKRWDKNNDGSFTADESTWK
ncbi:type IV pilin protein [Undibacterium sp. Ji50W]|uniref:type IV pilin protein n=1 Tax=Undibacterium sp. Ji50W TaxID=3413041 RepID=UPI003BF3E5D5